MVNLIIKDSNAFRYIHFNDLESLDSFTSMFNDVAELLIVLSKLLKFNFDINDLGYYDVSIDTVRFKDCNFTFSVMYADDKYDMSSLKKQVSYFLTDFNILKRLSYSGIDIEHYLVGATFDKTSKEKFAETFILPAVNKFFDDICSQNDKSTSYIIIRNVYHILSVCGFKYNNLLSHEDDVMGNGSLPDDLDYLSKSDFYELPEEYRKRGIFDGLRDNNCDNDEIRKLYFAMPDTLYNKMKRLFLKSTGYKNITIAKSEFNKSLTRTLVK